MKYMTGNEIREKFLKFFQDRGHLMLPSASLIPQDDPTLLIIGAGMAPFKPFFTGKMKPPATRITTCQKCVRTGDIENVGRTARHHTYFEMLGNFSFGDYFKKEVIPWSWEFLTKELGLPADKLYITIHTEDDEAFDIWHNVVGVPEDHIVRLADNWWEIGSGPCGPDSEIHIDLGPERGCGKPTCGPGCDCDRFLEIWNLVFTQFNQMPDGTYPPLKNKNIDTGAGLERLASVVQGKPSNFETDLIFPIIEYAAKIANVEYGKDKATDVSLKVIADHVRSMTFMIGDGILPSNEGRGYVLRRILRRAIRHARLLGINEMFLTGAVDVVIGMFGHAYPNLIEKADFIKKVVEMEETSFLRTLKQGCELLNEEIEKLKAANKTVLDGATAFKLNDTFGFPWELTEEILEEAGMTMDKEGFDAALEVQRKMAREARNDKEGRPVVYNTSGINVAELKVDEAATEAKIVKMYPAHDAQPIENAADGTDVAVICAGQRFLDSVGDLLHGGGFADGADLEYVAVVVLRPAVLAERIMILRPDFAGGTIIEEFDIFPGVVAAQVLGVAGSSSQTSHFVTILINLCHNIYLLGCCPLLFGITFNGGPRAWYCPDCRAERQLQRGAARRKTGAKRPLGSIDKCVICGKEYIVTGGRQKYCKDCAPEGVRAIDREQSKQWNKEHGFYDARREQGRNGVKICVICGGVIQPGSPAVTCSPECNRKKLRLSQAEIAQKHGVNTTLRRGSRRRRPRRVCVRLVPVRHLGGSGGCSRDSAGTRGRRRRCLGCGPPHRPGHPAAHRALASQVCTPLLHPPPDAG